jgi:hypothetical protein
MCCRYPEDGVSVFLRIVGNYWQIVCYQNPQHQNTNLHVLLRSRAGSKCHLSLCNTNIFTVPMFANVISINRRRISEVLQTSLKARVLLCSVVRIFTCQLRFPWNRLISRSIPEYGTDKYSIRREWEVLYVTADGSVVTCQADCDVSRWLWYISILVGKFLECNVPHVVSYRWTRDSVS